MSNFNKSVLFLFIGLLAVSVQAETVDISRIFADANSRFKNFVDDSGNFEVVIESAPETGSRTCYKKGRKIAVESKVDVTTAKGSGAPGAMDSIWIYDGEYGRSFMKANGKLLQTGLPINMGGVNNPFYNIFTQWWKLNQSQAKITGSKVIDTRDCYEICFGALPLIKNYTIWIDKQTLLIAAEEKRRAMSVTKIRKNSRTNKIEEYKEQADDVRVKNFSDYRKLAGDWEIPYVVTEYRNGTLFSKETVVSVKLDTALSDEMFNIAEPKQGQPPSPFTSPAPETRIPGNQQPARDNPFQPQTNVGVAGQNAERFEAPPPILTKEENVALKMFMFQTMNFSSFLDASLKDQAKITATSNPDEYIVNFSRPIYVSKIIFKGNDGDRNVGNLPLIYYKLEAQISCKDAEGASESLASFCPIGKSNYDLNIRKFVTQIKIKNVHPEYKTQTGESVFRLMFERMKQISLNCIIGKKQEKTTERPAAKAAVKPPDEKKKEVSVDEKTLPADKKLTEEKLPGLLAKAKKDLAQKDWKNNIEMVYIGSLKVEENGRKNFFRLDGKVYRGGDNIKWDMFTTSEVDFTSFYWFIHDYSNSKTLTSSKNEAPFDLSDLLLDWWESTGYEILKSDKIEAKECYILRKSEADNNLIIWIEKESNRVLRVKREASGGKGGVKKEEINYSYKKTKKEGFEFPSFIEISGGDTLSKTEVKILMLSRKLTAVQESIFDEKQSQKNNYLYNLKCQAINKRNKIQDKRDVEIEQYAEDMKDFKKNHHVSRKYADAISGFSFVVPEDFTRSIFSYNVYRYNPVKKKKIAGKEKELIRESGSISFHKSYTSEDLESIVDSYKINFLKKYPGAKIDNNTRLKIKDSFVAVVKVEYDNENGEFVKYRDILLKIKKALINIQFEYDMPEEDADRYQKNFLAAVAISEPTRVAHSFFSPKLEEIYKLKEDKKFEEAEKVIVAELEKFPNDAELLFMRAAMSAKKGDDEWAVLALKKAFESGYCDYASLYNEKDFEKLLASGKLDIILKDKAKLYATGRKNLLASVRKELASYYEVKMKDCNILIFTDISDKEYIAEINKFAGVFGAYEKTNINVEDTPFSVIWVLSYKGDVNRAMIGMLTGSEGYFSGLYVPAYGMLFTDIYSGIGVFSHEYTHALHAGDANKVNQAHPRWLTEMLSTSNEEVDYDEKRRTISMLNMGDRYESLLDGIANDRIIGFEKLIAMEDKALMDSKNIDMFYAEIRYLGMYLQQRGLMRQFYALYKQDYLKDKTGKKTLETVLGTKLSDFQMTWESWVLGLGDNSRIIR